MVSPGGKKTAPPAGGKWAPGAEPLALCMSCNGTFPPEVTECPNCEVGLSLVRKCPSCDRVQSAQHLTCIYCANSFMQEEGLGVLAEGPLKRRQHVEERLRKVAAGAAALVVLAGAVYFLTRRVVQKPSEPIAVSYVVEATSLRSAPSPDAPPIEDLEPPEVVQITDCAVDSTGNRWFRILSKDLSGYVRTRDVAPAKALNPETGFEALRHSLLALDDPRILGEAAKAVDNYRETFPSSPHRDEARWLLAERTRDLGEHTDRRLLSQARGHYRQLANSGGEYAERARSALAQIPEAAGGSASRRPASPPPLQFTVMGGGDASSRAGRAEEERAPVRKVTVLSQTPLFVRLTAPLELLPGAEAEGEIAEDIRVKNDVAIPRGSRARLAAAARRSASGSPLTLRLTALVIANETYEVSALAVRDHLPTELAVGTRLEFRLGTPLVIRER